MTTLERMKLEAELDEQTAFNNAMWALLPHKHNWFCDVCLDGEPDIIAENITITYGDNNRSLKTLDLCRMHFVMAEVVSY